MKNIIRNIAQEIADEKKLLLINMVKSGSNKKPGFEIYIDGKNGINANDCADFSREFKNKLEQTEYAELDYKLVVSSPGIDESIKFLDQYLKHINRDFKLSYDDGEKINSIEAKLINVIDDNLIFRFKNEEISLKFNNVKKAKVKISF